MTESDGWMKQYSRQWEKSYPQCVSQISLGSLNALYNWQRRNDRWNRGDKNQRTDKRSTESCVMWWGKLRGETKRSGYKENVRILRSLQGQPEQRVIQAYQANQPIMETKEISHQGQEWQDAAMQRRSYGTVDKILQRSIHWKWEQWHRHNRTGTNLTTAKWRWNVRYSTRGSGSSG